MVLIVAFFFVFILHFLITKNYMCNYLVKDINFIGLLYIALNILINLLSIIY